MALARIQMIVGSVASLAAISVFIFAACGGSLDSNTVVTPDGTTVRFKPGSSCATWDASTYVARVAEPPPCDPTELNGQPGCELWAHSLGLPLSPTAGCAHLADASTEAGVCHLGGGLATDNALGDCYHAAIYTNVPNGMEKNADGDRYCKAFLGQLVVGDGIAGAHCISSLDLPPEHGTCSNGPRDTLCGTCTDTILSYDIPPKPQICVQRNGTWRCESWCQQP